MNKGIYIKKRSFVSLNIFLFLCIFFSAFISCDANISLSNKAISKPVGVYTSKDSFSKGISASYKTLDANEVDLEDYYWFYIASKQDTGLIKGASDVYVPWNEGNKGLSNHKNEFSVGDWLFSFRACTSSDYNQNNVIFEGSGIKFTVYLDKEENNLYVPAYYIDTVIPTDKERDNGLSDVLLKGKISLDMPNITTKAEDITTYSLDVNRIKKYVTITNYDGTLVKSWSDSQLIAEVTTDLIDAGYYVVTVLYEYYDASNFLVSSYIAVNYTSVHGNFTTKLSGDINFIRLEDWKITYEDGTISYPNGRPVVLATTNEGYTGFNRTALLNEYGKYKYGTGIVFPTDTSPSDTADVDNSVRRSTKEGYNFLGYREDGGVTSVTSLSKTDAGAKTIYAYWGPKKSVITFKGNKGKGSTAVHADYTKNAFYDDLLPVITYPDKREGYRFGGYYLDLNTEDGEQVYTSASTPAVVANVKTEDNLSTITDASMYYKQTENRSLYAKWIPEVYTLRFKHNKSAYTSMSDTPTTNTELKVTFDGRTPFVDLSKSTAIPGWQFEGYGVEANATTPTDKMIYNRHDIVSGTDYVSKTNAAWIKDVSTQATEANAPLDLYAKWTQKKSVITLKKGTKTALYPVVGEADGEFVVKYDDTGKTAYTAVTINNTTYPGYVLDGYYTEPYGKGIKLIDSTGALITDTTTTNAGFMRTVGGKNKWFKYAAGEDEVYTLTLYAHFVDGDYTITFKPNDSTVGKGSTAATLPKTTQAVKFNNGVVPNYGTIPTRKGYIFDGFYLHQDCLDGEKVFDKTGTLVKGVNDLESHTSVTNASGLWTYPGSRELYAKWIPEKTTVTLNKKGSAYTSLISGTPSNPSPATVTFVFDTTLSDIVLVSVDGWKFEGWGLGDNTTTNSNMFTNSSRYVALTDYINSNKNWVWDDAATTGADHTLTVYAKWTRKKSVITLEKGDYGLADGKATVFYGNTALASFTAITSNTSVNPKKWKLDGYYTSSTGGVKILNANGTFNVDASSVSAGYYDSTSGKAWNKFHTGDEKDEAIILYAQWVNGVYTITFNGFGSAQSADGATGSTPANSVPSAKTVTHNVAIGNTTAPTRKGYIFDGWYLDKDFNNSSSMLFNNTGVVQASKSGRESGTVVSDADSKWQGKYDRTVYAKWTAETEAVTYNNNLSTYSATVSGNAISKASDTMTFDASLPLYVTATNTGWRFLGWMTAAADSSALLSGPNEWKSNITDWISSSNTWIHDPAATTGANRTGTVLYAKWTPAKTNITLDPGLPMYGSYGNATVYYDKTAVETTDKTLVVPKKTGTYADTVEGYYTLPQLMDPEWSSKTNYKVLNADLTFYRTATTEGGAVKGTAAQTAASGSSDVSFDQFFDSTTGKWRLYNKDDVYDDRNITLYAHYVTPPQLTVNIPTDIIIDWNYRGIYGQVGDKGTINTSIAYGDEHFPAGYAPGISNMGSSLVGLCVTPTDLSTMVCYGDGTVIRTVNKDGSVKKVDGYTLNGKWVYVPTTAKPTLKLYAVWSTQYIDPTI